MLNAHLAELFTELTAEYLSDIVYLIHNLASKVFNNPEVFLLRC
jgi:hypothetical protein